MGMAIVNDGVKIMLDRTFNADGDTTYTAPSEFGVGTSSTEPAITDTSTTFSATDVDITAGNQRKVFESGYPTENATTKQATIRARLASTEANGNNLTEFGVVNTDATELLFTRTTFTSFSKSDTDELIFVQKIGIDNEI